jgi:hypothetical protein
MRLDDRRETGSYFMNDPVWWYERAVSMFIYTFGGSDEMIVFFVTYLKYTVE